MDRAVLLRIAIVGAAVAAAIGAVATGAYPEGGFVSRPWEFAFGTASACGPPAWYRVDGGESHALGGCAGWFGSSSASLTIGVGQELDLRVAANTTADDGSVLAPLWPVPQSSDSQVLTRFAIADGGVTTGFIALTPGLALLQVAAACQPSGSRGETTFGRCSVLAVHVIP